MIDELETVSSSNWFSNVINAMQRASADLLWQADPVSAAWRPVMSRNHIHQHYSWQATINSFCSRHSKAWWKVVPGITPPSPRYAHTQVWDFTFTFAYSRTIQVS